MAEGTSSSPAASALEEEQRASAAASPAIDRGRRGAHRPGRFRARVRRLRRSWRRRPGPAPRLRDGLVARRRHPSQIVTPGDEITVKVLRVDEGTAEDLARAEAAPGRSLEHGRQHLRGGSGADRSRYARRGVRRVRRAGAGHRSVGARFDVCADRSPGRMGEISCRSDTTGGIRDPEHRPRAEAHRRCARGRGLVAGRWSHVAGGRRSCPVQSLTGKVERHEKFGVFVFLSPGRTGLMPFGETGVDRDSGRGESVSDRRRRRGRRARGRPVEPSHSSQQESGGAAARAG